MGFLKDKLFHTESDEDKAISREEAKNLSGSITIPRGMVEIADRLFDGNKRITSVTVPGTVKRIGDRAFAECGELRSVTLCEGIEAIGSNVFTGCKKLRRVTYPDSVKTYQGWTFYDTELEAPVMNVSKTLLVYCPSSVTGREWSVPRTVKTISWQAFVEHKELEILHLPEGLETIERMAFITCGIREITIPRSVREIGKSAFCRCKELEKVTILNPGTKVAFNAFDGCSNIKEIHYGELFETDKIRHLKGLPFLIQHTESPANFDHRSDADFIWLTGQCARGNSDAMNRLADWFESVSRREGASPFYLRAANYWRYRAYRRGNPQAVKWFNRYFKEHPGEPLESVLCENSDHATGWYTYSIPGRLLNDLGFDFFDPDRVYEIQQSEEDDIAEVSAYESEDGPDEDGFGYEEYYDWWFLDENLQPIPGVNKLNASTRERNCMRQFKEERAKTEEIIKQRKSKRG